MSRRFVLLRSYSTKSIKRVLGDAQDSLGTTQTINGWVRSSRKLKKVAFADVSDGSTAATMPIVMSPEMADDLSTGSCISVEGFIKESPGQQKYELEAVRAPRILGPASSDYPLQKKYHSAEFLRTIPQFRWKTAANSSVLRYRSFAIQQMSQYFLEKDFTQVNSPIITSSDCEGAGELFTLNSESNGPHFFGERSAKLSVSSQLHLEVFAAALSRVWNMAPAFRAEESDTNRHLSEFWMVEAEIAFVQSLDDLTDFAEGMVRSAVPRNFIAEDLLKSIRSEDRKELIKKRWEMLTKTPEKWPRVTYTQAVKILQKAVAEGAEYEGLKLPQLKWGDDLASAHEKYLTSSSAYDGPVFVTNYPKSIKPFYMKKSVGSEDEPGRETVAAFDLLVPGIGELIGGSLREDHYETLIANMEAAGMNIEDLDWYVSLRKYGSFPHGGYGLGFERLVCFVCGIENIRDAIGFPRWHKHCVC